MKELKPTKTCFYKQIFNQINLLLLLNICILFLSACTCNNSQPVQSPDPDPQKEDKRLDEAIVFIGRSGAGKSTMCNSIFGKYEFNSGPVQGLLGRYTLLTQDHKYEGKLYIDTPGLDSMDFSTGGDGSAELDSVYKSVMSRMQNNVKGYKIVVCIAWKDFEWSVVDEDEDQNEELRGFIKALYSKNSSVEYGIIFNIIRDTTLRKIETDPSSKANKGIQKFLNTLKKQPSAIGYLERTGGMEGKKNIYFDSTSENKKRLVVFLDKLKVNRIE